MRIDVPDVLQLVTVDRLRQLEKALDAERVRLLVELATRAKGKEPFDFSSRPRWAQALGPLLRKDGLRILMAVMFAVVIYVVRHAMQASQ